MTNHPNRQRIRVGMQVRHKLTGYEGRVIELGEIGRDPGALIQWIDRRGRRDGEPDWALLRNIDEA